jgi:hypothetical protein
MVNTTCRRKLLNSSWEQQLHICDLNDRALRHIDERKRILNGNDAPIHKNVDDIVAVMKELQLTLQRRHEVITGILTPIDMTTIATQCRS